MGKRVVKLNGYGVELATRSGEFILSPSNPAPPYILSQPIRNLSQTTWIKSINGSEIEYQTIVPQYDTVRMVAGTDFSFLLRAADLSNVVDTGDTSNLSFRWQKDGEDIFEINSLNGGAGLAGVGMNATPDLSGEYVCIVSNPYGSISSQPFTVDIFDPKNHPMLYTNLLVNGDGEGGLAGWTTEEGFTTKVFVKPADLTKNFGSFILGNLPLFDQDTYDTKRLESNFYFCDGSHWSLFFPHYYDRLKKDPTFSDINSVSKAEDVLGGAETWISQGVLAQIVPNEDYGISNHAGFFPGLAWLDQYNKNEKVVGLRAEFENHTTSYITRQPIKFKKHGEPQTVTMNQTIDLNDIGDIIDGQVFGVNDITAQFFAYVGAAISNYEISFTLATGEEITTNYFIDSPERLYAEIVQKINNSFNKTAFKDSIETTQQFAAASTNALARSLKPNSPVIITPKLYDSTTIEITVLDDRNEVLKTRQINGPDIQDVWAIKEKAYFPITLYPIFTFLKPTTNHDIIVFDQKYTDTNALAPFFDKTQPGPFTNFPGRSAGVTDNAAKFFLNKYNFQQFNNAYPDDTWYFSANSKKRAVMDHGAAAMFAVGDQFALPGQTRYVNISVSFTHVSDAYEDENPLSRGWTSQEIYCDVFGTTVGRSKPLVDYGNPRCGITKMKFILGANGLDISEDYPSYRLPQKKYTVVGLQRERLSRFDEFDTTLNNSFKYTLVQPEPIAQIPVIKEPTILASNTNSYNRSLEQVFARQQENRPPEEPTRPQNQITDISSTLQEDLDASIAEGEV